MDGPQAGKSNPMPGWIWLTAKSDPDGLSNTLRADSIIGVEPIWNKAEDSCAGTLVHLISGTVFESGAMPHEVEEAIADALK